MLENTRILLLGCGKMGGSMLEGWLEAGLKKENIDVVEPFEVNNPKFDGIKFINSLNESELRNEQYDFCIIAIKPQMFDDILPEYKNISDRISCFISIAAGKSVESLEKIFGDQARFIRIMPNLPATIGEGLSGVYFKDNVDDELRNKCNALLESNGEVIELQSEGEMDTLTAISGSGPGYIFHLIEAIKEIAIEKGFTEKRADILARQTVYGSAKMAKERPDLEPAELRKNVTSPGGTTEAGLNVLMHEDNGLKSLFLEAINAAERRSIELK
jgi:pyrroline-5-carboxylate reductase